MSVVALGMRRQHDNGKVVVSPILLIGHILVAGDEYIKTGLLNKGQ